MDKQLISQITLTNPWLDNPSKEILNLTEYKQRVQTEKLLSPEWDQQWLLLIGPRRAGKTTLGKYLSHLFRESGRFEQLFYLNCDYMHVRQFLDSPLALTQLLEFFNLKKPIVFIDEVQRLKNPGLLLKAIADLDLPIKMLASGSSQLEIKSKVQEFLTGRQLSTLILPLSLPELGDDFSWMEQSIYGSYPQVVGSTEKQMQLTQLYDAYIQKDIVEILKVGKPDILQKLLLLIAHSSGHLVNYNQLATDCGVTIKTVQNYLSILEQTFVLSRLQPFVGNKRVEVTSNPIYYFIDNGFRNQALSNFSSLESRNDVGLLIESLVFQEILKYKVQNFLSFNIHYWRTKSGAEVDFVLFKNLDTFIPVEVKYQNLSRAAITRSYRSFLQAYRPSVGVILNRNIIDVVEFEGCEVHFIPFDRLGEALKLLPV